MKVKAKQLHQYLSYSETLEATLESLQSTEHVTRPKNLRFPP